MLQNVKLFLITAVGLCTLFAATGCDSGPDKTRPAYENYQFNQKVIDRLPAYDSLAAVILKRLPLLRQINGNDSNTIFRYMPESTESEVFKRLPGEAGTEMDEQFSKLGKGFIYGFDVFSDSSIKIYVRKTSVDSMKLDIEENLSYYPAGINMRQREFPIKDSILNKHWQYWASFNRRGLFQ